MFTNVYFNQIDRKGRASVPSEYRDIMPAEEKYFQLSNFINDRPILEIVGKSNLDKLSHEFMRAAAHQIGKTFEFEPDGRIVIPQANREALDLDYSAQKPLVFFGLWHSFGICSSKNWPSIESSLLRAKNSAPLMKLEQKPK